MSVDRFISPDDLRDMNDEDFGRVVDADLRRNASNKKVRSDLPPEVSKALRTEHAERWFAALMSMHRSVEGQLANRAAELEAKVSYLQAKIEKVDADSTRPNPAMEKARLRSEIEMTRAEYFERIAGTERFRTGLGEALIEAQPYVGDAGDSVRFESLRQAVIRHQERVLGEGFEPTEADQELWAALETVTT